MASPIQNALKRKKELEQELAEIDRFLALYDRFSSAASPIRQDSPTAESARPDMPTIPGNPPSKPGEFADMVASVIRKEGRPLTRTELVHALEARGYNIPSADKPRYLGTILWRNRDRFVNVSGKGYALADMVTPDAGNGSVTAGGDKPNLLD